MKRLILMTACVAVASHTFAQEAENCVKTSVNLTGNQLTMQTSGASTTTTHQNYVFYERKRLRKHDMAYNVPGVAAKYPSKPIMLNDRKDVSAVPEQYNVSVAVPEASHTACADSAMNVTAMLSVERVASYTGNFPANKTNAHYKQVKKRHYKMAARKLRKIERKQDKIARKSNVHVEVKSTKA